MTLALLAFLTATITSLLLLPAIAPLARRLGLIDNPDTTRKLHANAIPLVGGIVVFLSALFSIVVTLSVYKIEYREADFIELFGLLVATTTLLVVGILDDRFNLRGRQKLLGQFIAVTVLVLCGYQFTEVAFAGFTIPLGMFSVFVIYAWCLAAINSVNLLDGADGFASTIGIVVSLSLSVMAFYFNQSVDGVICLAMAGGLVGFLRYNFPPAKAYLGDAGSMMIGLVLSAIAIRCAFKQAMAYAVFAPVALLAIPFIDTAAAIIRRRFTGRSIYSEDRGHLHHILAKRGLGPVASLIWVALLCTATAVGGTMSLVLRQSEYALASIGLVLVVMIAGRLFGAAEFQLVSRKSFSLLKSMFELPSRRSIGVVQSAIQLQGQQDWRESWQRLCEFAQENDLNQITLDVNAPWLHEAFHAHWKRSSRKTNPMHQWHVELPLVLTNRILGRVTAFADRQSRISHHDVVMNLLKVTGDIEQLILDAQDPAKELSSETISENRSPDEQPGLVEISKD